MSRENITIEDRLHGAGYKTERIGGVVNAHDPVHRSVVGSGELVVSEWKLVEIRSTAQAWAFIEARA